MRTSARHIGLLALSLMALSCTPEQQPNIIFLLADDQRVGVMGCEGNGIIHTPNLDRLAEGGTYFENSFVTTPICCTSRASILTGQYARRHGINDFHTSLSDSAFALSYPALLHQAGYHTGFVGKYGVGNKDEEFPKQHFDYWASLHASRYGGQGHYWQDSIHLTRVMEGQALEFISEAPTDKPFCLSISFKAPHCQDSDPRQFLYDTTRYTDLYREEHIPTPLLADEKYWELFPDFFRKEDSESRIRWRRRFSTPELYQEMNKGYYRLVTGLDAALGAIVEKLEEEGLADNTIIIFSSDNGFYLGERGLAGKWFSHDESIRVPLIIFDPRMPSGKGRKKDRVGSIALNIDIAPTILDYAGVEPPSVMQGRSLMPLLGTGESSRQVEEWREDFFFEHRFVRHNIPESEGVVSLDRKYIRYVEEEPDYEYLYDLKADPLELYNYRDSAGYSELLSKQRARYEYLIGSLE